MRYQIEFRQYNPKKLHRYVLLWKSLNDPRFPYTYESVPYTAKPQAGDGTNYIKTIINYMKCLVQGMGKQELIKSGTTSNWLLVQDDTKYRDELGATCHFEKDKKDLCLASYTVKTK